MNSRMEELEHLVSNLRRDLDAMARECKHKEKLYDAYIREVLSRIGFAPDEIQQELNTLFKPNDPA